MRTSLPGGHRARVSVCALTREFQYARGNEFIYLRDRTDWRGFVRYLPFFLPLTRIDLLRDIVRDLPAHQPVDGQLVQRGHLRRTMWTNEVLFEQMRLDTILTVSRPATRRLDRIPEDPMVYGADDAWVLRWPFTNFDLGETL